MSFPHSGESTFPDSRKPVRMDTEDQSFAGKPSHDILTTHGTHGTHGTHSTHGTHTNTDNNNVSTYTETMPLTGAPLVHHVHHDNEPLPGAKGGAKTFDYSPENIENSNDLSTGLGQSQPFHSGDQTTGGHANTARAYGGSTTEASGDFRGPTMASGTTDMSNLSSGVNPTHGSNTHTGTSNFARGHNDGDLAAKEIGTNAVLNAVQDNPSNTHGTHNTHDTSRHRQHSRHSQHSWHSQHLVTRRTDNYNTVTAAGNHDLNNPSHHTGVTGGANKTPYDGAGNESTNKPSIGDKIIGKTEQIAGKITKNAGLQEKGEIRKAGLKN